MEGRPVTPSLYENHTFRQVSVFVALSVVVRSVSLLAVVAVEAVVAVVAVVAFPDKAPTNVAAVTFAGKVTFFVSSYVYRCPVLASVEGVVQ